MLLFFVAKQVNGQRATSCRASAVFVALYHLQQPRHLTYLTYLSEASKVVFRHMDCPTAFWLLDTDWNTVELFCIAIIKNSRTLTFHFFSLLSKCDLTILLFFGSWFSCLEKAGSVCMCVWVCVCVTKLDIHSANIESVKRLNDQHDCKFIIHKIVQISHTHMKTKNYENEKFLRCAW